MNERYEKIFKPLQNGSDVRGSAIATEKEPKNLTPEIAADIAAGFLEWLEKKTGKPASELKVGVGHDSRLTADILKNGVLSGLSGARAYDCGLASTPSLFISTILPESAFDGAVMITASHLPFNRNGLKFFTKDGGLEKATAVLKRRISRRSLRLPPKKIQLYQRPSQQKASTWSPLTAAA